MKASELIQVYERFCPKDKSLQGDAVGLQIGSLEKEIKTVMVSLDIRESTVEEAIINKVDFIIVKHAPIFRPIQNLDLSHPQNRIYEALLKHDISVYVSHTNIDVVDEGLNDWFCEKLAIRNTSYLKETSENVGIGRVGEVEEQTFPQFIEKIKKVFQLPTVKVINYDKISDKTIRRVAICGGSGQGFYLDALEKQADVYITGDITYHIAQEMISHDLLAIDPGHHIEVLFTQGVSDLLLSWKEAFDWDVTILASQSNTNPFIFA